MLSVSVLLVSISTEPSTISNILSTSSFPIIDALTSSKRTSFDRYSSDFLVDKSTSSFESKVSVVLSSIEEETCFELFRSFCSISLMSFVSTIFDNLFISSCGILRSSTKSVFIVFSSTFVSSTSISFDTS